LWQTDTPIFFGQIISYSVLSLRIVLQGSATIGAWKCVDSTDDQRDRIKRLKLGHSHRIGASRTSSKRRTARIAAMPSLQMEL
jgi:hypothetical protein